MDYYALIDHATELGYRLAMAGAETFRVEDTVRRVLGAYGIEAEIFAIPNCLIVSIETHAGKPMTRMRRIGFHGNDLNAVEEYNSLSRQICAEKPEPEELKKWMQDVSKRCRAYPFPAYMLGNFLGAMGFSIFFGGTLGESLLSGICGLLVGIIVKIMDRYNANPFFRTIFSSFAMAVMAYGIGCLGWASNYDALVIGALMILVPGLIFTNAMRDIIYGDTNSGVNRIVQVFLYAGAIALGTAAAWSFANSLWSMPESAPAIVHGIGMQLFGCLLGCIGFGILFNIYGRGMLLCALGGCMAWAAYLLTQYLGASELLCFFVATIIGAGYSEIMAKIRKCPAICYLVVAIFPLIPGAGIYYAMNYAVRGDLQAFVEKTMQAGSIAGCIAVGILMISTIFRMWSLRKESKHG